MGKRKRGRREEDDEEEREGKMGKLGKTTLAPVPCGEERAPALESWPSHLTAVPT